MLFGEQTAGIAAVEECVTLSYAVKAGHEDLEWLYPGVPAGESAARRLAPGPDVVIVTCGREGAFTLTRDGEFRAAAIPSEVVDTVGAGDSFTAAVLASPAGHAPDARAVSRSALRAATAAAAITVSRVGAKPPTATELVESLSGAEAEAGASA
ncbi:PfkB family carbohydrate kinase [Streptomyces sp. NPDC013171]|uniref:PfkB family carbohydrate kinase n=1 Tax=Streptomyces sp. NPDC013171 TaxID=3364863 RepID=UPI0036BA848E